MGLLSRISAGLETPAEITKESSSDQVVSAASDSEKLSFFDFIHKNSLSHCCIFKKINSIFVSSFSWGFDGDTILQSISTSDFWEGTIKPEQWNTFSREENSLNTMLQFFSEKLKSNFNFVYVYEINDYILLIAEESVFLREPELDKISADFLNIDLEKLPEYKDLLSDNETPCSVKCTFSIENALNEIMEQLSPSMKTNMSCSFISETCNLMRKLFTKGSYEYLGNYKFSVSLNSESRVSDDVLKLFLKTSLSVIFKDKSSFISYDC